MPSDEEEPEDLQLPEIRELEKSIVDDIWPSECLRLLSGEFAQATFMDEDEFEFGGGHAFKGTLHLNLLRNASGGGYQESLKGTAACRSLRSS